MKWLIYITDIETAEGARAIFRKQALADSEDAELEAFLRGGRIGAVIRGSEFKAEQFRQMCEVQAVLNNMPVEIDEVKHA